MAEDYTKARTLHTIEFLGETFRVVRRRVNGKPWRKYLTLLHGNVPMVESILDTTDPIEAGAVWRARLSLGFQTAGALKEAIADQRKRVGVT